jgi:hypothetical protein
MPRQALHVLQIVNLPKRWQGKKPPLGLATVGHEDVDDEERERIAAEGGKGALLISKATPAQTLLLERLARAAWANGLRFQSVDILERFLTSSGKLDAKAAAALSDADVAALWRDAGGRAPGEPQESPTEGEPNLRMRLRAKWGKTPPLEIDIVEYGERPPDMDDLIAQDAHIGRILISKASPAQVLLLERLTRAAGDDGLRFPLASILARFLAATRTLDVRSAAKVTDEDLTALWRDAAKERIA